MFKKIYLKNLRFMQVFKYSLLKVFFVPKCSYHNVKKIRHSSLITLFFLSFLLFHSPINSQNEVDKMDEILQKELGNKPKKSDKIDKSDSSKNNTKLPEEKSSNPIQDKYQTKEEASSLLWVLVRIIGVFGILTAGMYYILKFISKNNMARYPVKGAIRVLSSTPISPGKQLQIVDIHGMLLVIGVAEQSISLVAEIQSPEIKEKIFMSKDDFEPISDNFLTTLLSQIKNTANNYSTKKEEQENVDANQEDLMSEIKSRQMERLEKLKKERDELSQKLNDKPNSTNGDV